MDGELRLATKITPCLSLSTGALASRLFSRDQASDRSCQTSSPSKCNRLPKEAAGIEPRIDEGCPHLSTNALPVDQAGVRDLSDPTYPVLAGSLRARKDNIRATIGSLEMLDREEPKAAYAAWQASRECPLCAGLMHPSRFIAWIAGGRTWQCEAVSSAYTSGKSISHVSPWSRQSKRTSPLS